MVSTKRSMNNMVLKFMVIIFSLFFGICANAQNNEIKSKAYYFTAKENYENKNYKAALQLLNKSEEIGGASNAYIESLKAQCHGAMENWIEANKALDKCYTFNPNNTILKELSPVILKVEEELEGAREAQRIRLAKEKKEEEARLKKIKLEKEKQKAEIEANWKFHEKVLKVQKAWKKASGLNTPEAYKTYVNTVQGQWPEVVKTKGKNIHRYLHRAYEKYYSVNPMYPQYIMVFGGSFKMGALNNQKKTRPSDEFPSHKVEISSFNMGKTEVTIGEYKTYLFATGKDVPIALSGFDDDQKPITDISWKSAIGYCKWLTKVTGKKVRLPYEAEWEYAARGGIYNDPKAEKRFSGAEVFPDEVAWYKANSIGNAYKHVNVGSKKPNELGLYDMTGSVWEMCMDYYKEDYYKSSPKSNPTGPYSGSSRVIRGGSNRSSYAECLVSNRKSMIERTGIEDVGFRVVAQ